MTKQQDHSPDEADAGRAGPLAGVRVVEFGGIGPAPFCGMLLADMGAAVTLIEKPQGTLSAQLFGGGRRTIANRGKRSIAVDLKAKAARPLIERLIRDADVLLEGFRPGVMERLGFGPESCLADNPRLIYGSITGYGLEGPESDRAAYDIAAFWARSGIAASLTQPGGMPPFQRGGMGDHNTGLAAAGAISAALFAREKTGRGQP